MRLAISHTCAVITCLLQLCINKPAAAQQKELSVDICVYGGTASGVMAAYTASKMGKKVLLIEPGKHVGGLTTGGLGYTDIGNKYAVTGLARDFYRRIGAHYGKFEQWIFEPHVAENILLSYSKKAAVPIQYQRRLVRAVKQNGFISTIITESSNALGKSSFQTIRAKVFIDCSYEGDLMAAAGVRYFTGREDNTLYGETYNGVQLRDKHQFPDGIDPYRIPGHPESGLLWGISDRILATAGSGDKNIQAYNFRLCLTNDPANRIPITRPADYDSTKYELLLRYLAKYPAKSIDAFMKIDRMPNHKTDINNNGPFSTDMIGMNYDYPEADYAKRAAIQSAHEAYVKGLLYLTGHDARMPAALREQMLQWGYPKDEYTDNGNWSSQMYVREARRMQGVYVMTQANCEGKEKVTDGIGMAAYTMDSHNTQRIVVNGMVKNEGDVQIGGFGPYPISYRAIIPRKQECSNLLVPVCLSATHIAYGSIRMEPVFMVLGQSAAMAAVMAINQKATVQDINVAGLQQELKAHPLADNSIPEILLDDSDSLHVSFTGNWKTETRGGYGPTLHTSTGNNGEQATAVFSTAIQQTARYNLYLYYPKTAKASSITQVTVSDGKTDVSVLLRDKDIRVEGQTSGEWVSLGVYTLTAGSKATITISNKDADGTIAADAILLVPETGTAVSSNQR
jgi:hypothetical protein